MTEEQSEMLEWEDLPLKVRKNRKHMYNYLKSIIQPENDSEGE